MFQNLYFMFHIFTDAGAGDNHDSGVKGFCRGFRARKICVRANCVCPVRGCEIFDR